VLSRKLIDDIFSHADVQDAELARLEEENAELDAGHKEYVRLYCGVMDDCYDFVCELIRLKEQVKEARELTLYAEGIANIIEIHARADFARKIGDKARALAEKWKGEK